jgi:hypothetical protein
MTRTAVRWIFVALCLLFLAGAAAHAQEQEKVLLYYFQNLTGNRSYEDLTYRITLCLYRRLESNNRFLVMEPPEERKPVDAVDLFDSNYMNAVATKKRISRVLFGYFYLEDGNLALKPRVYYLESGLILDLTPQQEEMYSAVMNIEDMSVEQIRSCAPLEETTLKARKQKEVVKKKRKPPPGEIIEAETYRTMTWSMGPAVTLSDWSTLYPTGLAALINYLTYPKGAASRLAIGFQTGVLVFTREADEFAASSTVIIPLGVGVQYALIKSGDADRLFGYGVLGLAYSGLSLSGTSTQSIDLYSRLGLGANLLSWEQGNLYAGIGVSSVNYQDAAMNMITGEFGLRFFD